MKIYIFPFLFISIICILVFRIFMKNSSNGFDEAVGEFEEKEKEANYTIKNIKDLEIRHIYPNKEILPFKEYDEENKELKGLIKKQAQVKRKFDLEMAKLPLGLTNTELKIEYGINNFEKITIMEDHYNGYIRALFEWAMELKNFGNNEDCKIILEECARLEGDISQIYTNISDIYFEEKNKHKLIELKENIYKFELSFKDKILEYIEEKINLLK